MYASRPYGSPWPVSAAAFVSCILISAPAAYAEVTLDGTLRPAGPPAGPDYAISDDLGQLRGANLFHSFGDFTITTGESATFTGPTTAENILGRVTGGSASLIDGRLSSQIPGANLYLMNPSGLMFGPSAALDISGSFHATTADYIGLADGGRFDATTPSNSVLTTAPPEAFGFLSAAPAQIDVQGGFLPSAMPPSGTDLNLVGGNVTVDGAVDLDSVPALGAVNVGGNVIVDTAALYIHGGDIVIDGGFVSPGAASFLLGLPGPEPNNGLIDLRARGDLTVTPGASSTVIGSTLQGVLAPLSGPAPGR